MKSVFPAVDETMRITDSKSKGWSFIPLPRCCLWLLGCGVLLTLKSPQLGWSEAIVAVREMFLHEKSVLSD